MAYRTLQDLRTTLIRRLGFGAAGASAGVISANVDNFLLSAHIAVYEAHDWKRLKSYEDKSLGANQFLIDYPTNANPERIKEIWVIINGVYQKVHAGISPQDYTFQNNKSWPVRYELYDQIELYPKSDAVYTVRIWYIKAMTRFTENADRCQIDDNLVFLHALYNAKLHYKQADGTIYQLQYETQLSKLKANSWTKTVYNPIPDDDFLEAKPKVI